MKPALGYFPFPVYYDPSPRILRPRFSYINSGASRASGRAECRNGSLMLHDIGDHPNNPHSLKRFAHIA
jgi:hypothetical protein